MVLRMAAAALGWALLAASAVASGDPSGVLRSGVAVVVLVAAVALTGAPAVRRATVVALALYLAALVGATLLVGSGQVPDAGEEGRLELFTGNPNVLGAALVVAAGAWAAVAPRRRWVWWVWPLAALAVLHTGSRTAGGALLAAGTLWVVIQALRGRPKLLLAPAVALAVLAAAALAWQRGVVELTPNLLASPSDFTDPAWRHDLAERVSVIPDAGPGPIEGTSAQRLVATARPQGTHLAHQSIGRSEEGVPYVASIFLRSDTPQRIVLSSHLARVTCEVDAEWRRCVTPVGYGDDHAQRQLHLRAPERGGSVDVYLFGAQYERGTAVTPFLDLRPSWVPQAMVNRYDLRRVTFLPANRMTAWTTGLEIARERPWVGVGLEASRRAFEERTGGALSGRNAYAHNVFVQLLAVHGVLGLLGATVVAAAVLAALGPAGWARLAPLLVGLLLLNTWDVTLFEPTSYGPAVLAVAYWVQGGPARSAARRFTTEIISHDSKDLT